MKLCAHVGPCASACGFGCWEDPAHLRCCLRCNSAAWSAYRRQHPGPVRRFFQRLGDRVFGTEGLPIPPSWPQ